MNKIILCLFIIATGTILFAQTPDRAKILNGTIGTYAALPRKADATPDFKRLVKELKDIKANTYHWLIFNNKDSLSVLEQFLPMAKRKSIKVWVTIVPPSEQAPIAKSFGYAEPYRLDFEAWARELAKLSLKYPNLIAWSIDDYAHNLKFFTPEYMEKILAASKAVNPDFLFVPCVYYKQITLDFVERYSRFFDGILFPYRAESRNANLQDADLVASEIETIRKILNKKMPIILDVYATAHSRLGASTPEYVRDVVANGLKSADGVLIYRHQDPEKQAEKYKYIRKLFRERKKQ